MTLPQIKKLTAKELVKALKKDGFKCTTKKGGHLIFRHPDNRRVTIAYHHSGDTFPPKTLNNIIQDAGWTEENLKKLGLIK